MNPTLPETREALIQLLEQRGFDDVSLAIFAVDQDFRTNPYPGEKNLTDRAIRTLAEISFLAGKQDGEKMTIGNNTDGYYYCEWDRGDRTFASARLNAAGKVMDCCYYMDSGDQAAQDIQDLTPEGVAKAIHMGRAPKAREL